MEIVKKALASTFLNATAFHASFQLGEQQAAVLPATLQTVGAATAAMLIVSFLFIPKLSCCLCLTACIISTNLGVVGCMALWGVRLDIVSMITVLMSIGISVDFVAHVSYFYVQAMELNLPVSKAQRALGYLGKSCGLFWETMGHARPMVVFSYTFPLSLAHKFYDLDLSVLFFENLPEKVGKNKNCWRRTSTAGILFFPSLRYAHRWSTVDLP